MAAGRSDAAPSADSASAEALAESVALHPLVDARRDRGRPWERVGGHVLANLVPLLVLALWWFASQNVAPFILPDPFRVFQATGELLWGQYAGDTWTSGARILISVVLAVLLGGLLVFVAALVPITERLVGNRILPFFNSVPALGWAILGVIWFGIGNFAVVFVVTAIIIPFCMVNLWEGMRALDPELREMGRSFTRRRLRILAWIEAPLLLPYLFAAARLSFSVGWKVALIAEFFGASAGLGLVMNNARQNFDSETVFATIMVVLIVVTVAERLIFDPLARWFAVRAGTAPA